MSNTLLTLEQVEEYTLNHGVFSVSENKTEASSICWNCADGDDQEAYYNSKGECPFCYDGRIFFDITDPRLQKVEWRDSDEVQEYDFAIEVIEENRRAFDPDEY